LLPPRRPKRGSYGLARHVEQASEFACCHGGVMAFAH
jgi:hypothetical protein